MVEIFKTNVTEPHQALLVVTKLKLHFPASDINFDLEDCDHILRIEGVDVAVDKTIRLVNLYGFDCEVIL